MQPILQTIFRSFQRGILILLTTSTAVFASNNTIIATPEPTDSPAIKVGNLVFISGQGTGSTKTPDPTGAAMKEAFQKIQVIAKQMGGDLTHVIKLTVYMADLSHDYPLLNDIVPQYFKKPYPTRSTVGVASLPKDHRIEIDAVIALKKN
jgi:reactive intermediate/imine deaminase